MGLSRAITRSTVRPSLSLRRLLTFSSATYLSACSAGIAHSHTCPRISEVISPGLPQWTIRPDFITRIRSAMDSTSDTMWVERITIRLLEKALIRLRKRTRSLGSSPVVGSSRINIRGSFSMAWAIPSRCFMPPEKVLILCLASRDNPTSSRSPQAFLSAAFPSRPFSAAM